MKALDKERSRRYESVAAFAGDVKRFFSDKPVVARPPSSGYRFRKFALRNKMLLASLFVVGCIRKDGSAADADGQGIALCQTSR